MPNYRIKLACTEYHRTSAILNGRLKLDGVDLDLVEMRDVATGFTDVFRGEFDVGEYSTTELIFYLSRNRGDLIGIPIFPRRSFRHSFIFYNATSNINGPQSLKGKRVGCGWVQTADVWVRGILSEEYGLAPKDVAWHGYAVHHWDEDNDTDQIQPRDGSVIRWVDTKGQNRYLLTDQDLLEGKIDALVFPRPPISVQQGDKRVKRLFDNYREVELAYYKKTRIFPIMHTMVMKRSVAERHPDLPGRLFKLFCEAERIGRESTKSHWKADLAWKDYYLEEEEKIFGGNPWAHGLKNNEHVLEKLISYCYDQGVADIKLSPKDLFVPSTWELTDPN